MPSLELTKEEYQFIYETVREATLKDERLLTCDHCPANFTGCKCWFCNQVKHKLYKLIESM